jgi:hypothetical protein
MTTYDEYFPLVARDHHVSTTLVPILIAVTVVGQAVGTALVGRTSRARGGHVGAMLAGGAVLISIGALTWPYAGFVAIAVGYGLANNAMVVGETRLQHLIVGPARATVTSVLGVLEELGAIAVFACFAVGSRFLGFPLLVALLAVPALMVAGAVRHWLPEWHPIRDAGGGVEDSAVGTSES